MARHHRGSRCSPKKPPKKQTNCTKNISSLAEVTSLHTLHDMRARLTLLDDEPLHALFELIGRAQAFDGSSQHSLLMRQSAFQLNDLTPQHFILYRTRTNIKGESDRVKG